MERPIQLFTSSMPLRWNAKFGGVLEHAVAVPPRLATRRAVGADAVLDDQT